MTLRKHAWILLCLLWLALWIAGCGGGGGSSDGIHSSPDDYLAEAPIDTGEVVRWTQPIGVYLDRTNIPADWKPEHADIFLNAMDEWADAAQGKFSFVSLTAAADPCITVKWVTDHPLGEDPPTIGVSQLILSVIGSRQYIQRVRIEISTNGQTGAPLPDSIMRLVSIHELGHAIGIWGHSDDPNDIMFDTLGGQSGLSTRDINTINRLYSLDADIYQLPQSKRGIIPEETKIITMP